MKDFNTIEELLEGEEEQELQETLTVTYKGIDPDITMEYMEILIDLAPEGAEEVEFVVDTGLEKKVFIIMI